MNEKVHLLRILLVFLIAPLFLHSGCKQDRPAESRETSELPPPETDYPEEPFKWGFMDLSGRQVIPAVFDEVRPFSEGLAVVRLRGKWGFIDKQGHCRDKGRHCLDDRQGPLRRDRARTGRVKNQANGIGAQLHGTARIGR